MHAALEYRFMIDQIVSFRCAPSNNFAIYRAMNAAREDADSDRPCLIF
jgi:hypothetical protein